MAMQPLVYIILVNYNGYKDTIECVNSLKNITYENYKVVIIDNASTDNSKFILNEALSDCAIIIETEQNLGFSGGNNIGIKYALQNNADYVMLLNNDTLVEAEFLNSMINSFNESNEIGLVGCKIMYYPKKDIIWYGGGRVNWFKFIGEHYGMKESDIGKFDHHKEIDFMTGCCMLIKKEVFEKTGLLSEEYFMYFEDVDFCVKLKDAGYKIWYNPKAVIYHKVGFASGGEESAFSIKWCTRNRLLFMDKYRSKVSLSNYIFSKMFFYSSRIIRYLQYTIKGKKVEAESIIEGIKSSKYYKKNNNGF